MKKKIKQRITSIVMAVFTACMMLPASSSVYAEPKNEPSSPVEYRWNFQSNEISGNNYDRIYMGEKVQPYDKDLYENVWRVGLGMSFNTDSNLSIPLMTGSALLVEPYKITSIDYDTINDRINSTWTNKLFSQRELAVLDTGEEENKATPFNEEEFRKSPLGMSLDEITREKYINKHKGEVEYIAGNSGLKVWGTNYSGFTADDYEWMGGPWGDTNGPIFYKEGGLYDIYTLPLNSYISNPNTATGFEYGKYDTHGKLVGIGMDCDKVHFFDDTVYYFVRPECRVSNKRIVIRSDALGKDSGPLGPDALLKVNKTETHDWKFTILENDRNFRIIDTKVSANGKTVTIKYAGNKIGDNEFISAIFEINGEIYYGNIALSSEDRTASVNLPYEFTKDSKLCVFNENCNGAWKTDFCSNVVEVNPTAHIKFDPNGGNCPTTELYAESNSYIGTFPSAERPGYIFTGWYDNKDGIGKPFTENDSLDFTEDYTFYAGWIKCPTIIFDGCGGAISPASAVVKETGKLEVLPTPTRDGYKFLGWYTEKDAKGDKITLDRVYKEDMTIYAGWEETSPTPSPSPETSANPVVSPSPDKSPEPDVTRDTSDISPSNPTKVEDIEKTILNIKDEKDTKGSTFTLLKAKGTPKSKKSIKLSWSKVPGAEEYIIYGNKCGKKNKYKKIATVKGTSYTAKKLKKGTYYKYTIVAVKGAEAIATSKTIHVVTDGGKKGNNTKVKLSKTKLSLTAGKSKKIKATLKYNKKVATHRKVAWESDNVSIATVKNGKITAVGKGTCYVYAYAQNGVSAKIKVTVK